MRQTAPTEEFVYETYANASHTHHEFTDSIDVLYEVHANYVCFDIIKIIMYNVTSESRASDSCSDP